MQRLGALLNVLPVLVVLALIAVTAGLFHARYDTLGSVLFGVVTGSFLFAAGWLTLRNIGDWSNLQQLYNSRRRSGPPQDGAVIAHEGRLEIDGEPLTAPFTGRRCAAYGYRVMYRWQGTRRSGNSTESRLVAGGFHMLPMRVAGPAQTFTLRAFPSVEDDCHAVCQDGSWHTELLALLKSLPEPDNDFEDIDRHARWLRLQRDDVESVREDYVASPPGEAPERHLIEEWIVPVNEAVCVMGTCDTRQQALVAGRWRPGGRLMVYRGTQGEVLPRVWQDVKGFGRVSLFLLLSAALFYAVTLSHPSALSELLIGPGIVAESGEEAGKWIAGGRAAFMLWAWPAILLLLGGLAARTLPSTSNAAQPRDD